MSEDLTLATATYDEKAKRQARYLLMTPDEQSEHLRSLREKIRTIDVALEIKECCVLKSERYLNHEAALKKQEDRQLARDINRALPQIMRGEI